MKNKVLIPLDGSAFGAQIADTIIEFLDPARHELILLRVMPRPQGMTARPPRPVSVDAWQPEYESDRELTRAMHPIYASQALEAEVLSATDTLAPVRRRLEANGFSVHTSVVVGEPRREIERIIREDNIDLVAMTTHGRTGLMHLLMGSVAEHVLRFGGAPVLMLRPSLALQELLREEQRLAHA